MWKVLWKCPEIAPQSGIETLDVFAWHGRWGTATEVWCGKGLEAKRHGEISQKDDLAHTNPLSRVYLICRQDTSRCSNITTTPIETENPSPRFGKNLAHATTQTPRTRTQLSHAVLPLESPDSTAVTGGFRPS